jgi:hypothetical protein
MLETLQDVGHEDCNGDRDRYGDHVHPNPSRVWHDQRGGEEKREVEDTELKISTLSHFATCETHPPPRGQS